MPSIGNEVPGARTKAMRKFMGQFCQCGRMVPPDGETDLYRTGSAMVIFSNEIKVVSSKRSPSACSPSGT